MEKQVSPIACASEALSLSQLLYHTCDSMGGGHAPDELDAFTEILEEVFMLDADAPRLFLQSALTKCNACTQACPVSALLERFSKDTQEPAPSLW